QYRMLKLVLLFKKEAERALEAGVYLNKILELEVRDKIARAKYISEDDIKRTDEISEELKGAIDDLISKGGVLNA
ncbi:V-type ATP synthase subunit A, partial [Clostridium saudiense]|nr:V-type ATP synthase subunit A [Clostridium saudiense]